MDVVAAMDQGSDRQAQAWALLIYTVPASPTSKRAAVWREVKRLGALYLRDGVCALPDTAEARAGLEALAGRVQDLGGQASVARGAYLSPARAEALQLEFSRARQAEYDGVAEAATDLLRHIREEATHHGFDRAARVNIAGDIGRLRRWLEQAVARDYQRVGDPVRLAAMLDACRAELETHAAPAGRERK